jgi:8-amino-7-oxononanoate synthase
MEETTGSEERPGLAFWLRSQLQAVESAGLLRKLRRIDSAQDARVQLAGREVLLFCSNNYLGLANHPEVVEAARLATLRFGAGAGASRLVSGHMRAHAELEEQIAEWKGCEAALVFSTGYQANVGVIASLLGPGDAVVSDELNHASIIDGCRLSRARIVVYRHNDVTDLRRRLDECRDCSRVLVVTESIFSMDGDCAPLAEIAKAAGEVDAWLMVDEAHAAGIFGPGGAGVGAELGLSEQIHIHIGTLGKALGSFGAYVAGSRPLIDWLVNRARPFVFTTALPPSAVAAARAAIDLCKREPERAAGLRQRARDLGLRLRDAGLDVPNVDSQILPVMLGDPRRAAAVAERLLERGFYLAAIRPPTVPQGTSRLRLSLMATHTESEIAQLAEALVECAHAASA